MAGANPVPGWIEQGGAKFKKDVVPQLPPTVQPGALKVLELVEDRKGVIGDLSAHEFATVVSYVGIGLDSEAKRVWLRGAATHEEAQASLVAAIKGSNKGHLKDEAQWGEIKDLALEVIKEAGPFVLPILLGLA